MGIAQSCWTEIIVAIATTTFLPSALLYAVSLYRFSEFSVLINTIIKSPIPYTGRYEGALLVVNGIVGRNDKYIWIVTFILTY